MYLAYDGFATVYDIMQYNIDYDLWVDQFQKLILEYGQSARSGLELGCGTGTIAIGMSKKGYVMDGVDLSSEMLVVAQQKSKTEGAKINFYQQDIRALALKKQYDFILAPCDALNYIESIEVLKDVFNYIASKLNEGGLFLFDLSTAYKFKNTIGDQTFAETFDESAFIWENHYDEDLKKLDFYLTLFVSEDGVYKRIEEYHEQYAYDQSVVMKALEGTFQIMTYVDGDTFTKYNETSERILYICKKK